MHYLCLVVLLLLHRSNGNKFYEDLNEIPGESLASKAYQSRYGASTDKRELTARLARHCCSFPFVHFLCLRSSLPTFHPPGRHRWVDYQQHDFNASQVEPSWHAWLHHIRKDPPSSDPVVQKLTPTWQSVSWANVGRLCAGCEEERCGPMLLECACGCARGE